MLLDQVFEKFIAKSPVSVMVRGTLEYALQPQLLNDLFEQHAEDQYIRTLLFSTVVDLLSLVTCGVHASVRAAYQAAPEDVAVSLTSVYNKRNGLETPLAAELLRFVFRQLEPVQRQLGGALPELIPGYHTRLLDGNRLAATEHRLGETRDDSAAPLPGQALVVLDPALMLLRAVFPCEDGHAQERSLLDAVLQTVCDRDVWMADRNFCVLSFLLGVAQKGGCFLIREHKGLTWQSAGNLRFWGRCASGWVRAQRVSVLNEAGQRWFLRRVVLQLDQPTRDGESELALLTNLPRAAATSLEVAEHSRKRWTIEKMFQQVTEVFDLRHLIGSTPQATVFQAAFCLLLYNLIQVVRGYLAEAQGAVAGDTISTPKLFLDGTRQLTAWNELVAASDTVSWLQEGIRAAAPLKAYLRERLAGLWKPEWDKAAPKPRRREPTATQYLKGGQSSVFRILRGLHKLTPEPAKAGKKRCY